MSVKRPSATLVLIALLAASCSAFAELADQLEKFVGYTVLTTKTVDSWLQDGKRNDGFEGCEYNRVIVFSDGSRLTCMTYNYSYDYRPTAVLIGKQMTFQGKTVTEVKMVVGDEVYDMVGR